MMPRITLPELAVLPDYLRCLGRIGNRLGEEMKREIRGHHQMQERGSIWRVPSRINHIMKVSSFREGRHETKLGSFCTDCRTARNGQFREDELVSRKVKVGQE